MDKEFLIPIGKAKIERAGTDVTITALALRCSIMDASGIGMSLGGLLGGSWGG